jgi:hypothetical protein
MKAFIGKYPKNPDAERKVNVRIDPWDTWSMDNTLAHIITPMLKQLKATQHGAPKVDLEDVPEELRPEKLVGEYDVDENYFKRWEYVLDEMIFAFESKLTDWEDQFWKVKPEIDWNDPFETGKVMDGFSKIDVSPLKWRTSGECDWDARAAYQARITNGFRLFGKYYEGLWD